MTFDLTKYYCQKCICLGLETYNLKIVCIACGHDNTEYVNNDSVENYFWNHLKTKKD